MRIALGYIAIATSILVPVCRAQSLDYEASVFSGYPTSAYPFTAPAQTLSPGVGQLGSDVPYGVSATVGWQRNRDRTNFLARYTATYVGSVQYSDLNALNHALSLSVSMKLSS